MQSNATLEFQGREPNEAKKNSSTSNNYKLHRHMVLRSLRREARRTVDGMGSVIVGSIVTCSIGRATPSIQTVVVINQGSIDKCFHPLST